MAVSIRFERGRLAFQSISLLGANIRGKIRKEFLRNVGIYLVRSTKKGILEQKSPSGKKYAPLAPKTVKKRGQKILVDTAQMMNSITFKTIAGRVVDGSVLVGPEGSRTGSNVTNEQLSVFHQLGTKKMPARPFLGLNKAHNDKQNIDNIAKRYLNDQIKRSRRR